MGLHAWRRLGTRWVRFFCFAWARGAKESGTSDDAGAGAAKESWTSVERRRRRKGAWHERRGDGVWREVLCGVHLHGAKRGVHVHGAARR